MPALIGLVGALVVVLAGLLGTATDRGTAAQQVGTPDPSQQGGLPPQMNAVAVVERVAPAVVTVINLQTVGGFGQSGVAQPAGSGTGFIIDQQGHIVTNQHVVAGGDQFEVIFANGEERPAQLVGADPVADLAVVRIDGGVPATVQFGDSEALRVGEPVLALGSPLGEFTNTVTEGIVSALDRTFPEPGSTYTNLIQHDAAINPGNSGGPLFNAAGEVVGVNTLGIQGAQGLFFAIPSNTVTDIVTTLINEGEVNYPYMGVETEPVTDELAAQYDLPVDYGVGVIGRVQRNSPAGQAGIQPGDIILALNGQRIDAQHPFVEVLFQFEPGQTVTATIQRGEEQFDVQVTLGERPESQA